MRASAVMCRFDFSRAVKRFCFDFEDSETQDAFREVGSSKKFWSFFPPFFLIILFYFFSCLILLLFISVSQKRHFGQRETSMRWNVLDLSSLLHPLFQKSSRFRPSSSRNRSLSRRSTTRLVTASLRRSFMWNLSLNQLTG